MGTDSIRLLLRDLICEGAYDAVVQMINPFPVLVTEEMLTLALYKQDCRMIAYFLQRGLTVKDFGFLLLPDKYPDAKQKIVVLLYDYDIDFTSINFDMIRLLLAPEFAYKLRLQLRLCRAVRQNKLTRVRTLLIAGARYPCRSLSNEMFVLLQTLSV